MAKKQSIWVLVTTKNKGVFFGLLNGDPGVTVTIKRARNCLYWSKDVRGFLGLASTGPSQSCRVGPAVPSLMLFDVTSIAECTPEAVTAWEAAPWDI